ncbi:MAG: four helix bundle protein [Planctomycetia bacterium]|nr:four helix bundle protein [Planctomycetia bacterium]
MNHETLQKETVMPLKSYRELIVWQKAMDLVESIYRTTKAYPREEIYGLTSQTRRSAVSVPSNIAEGQGRRTTNEFLKFLAIASGSLCELDTQILIAKRLQYIDANAADSILRLASEVGRLVSGLARSLRKKREGDTNH